MSMLRETHHEKICLHLLENGGEATHSSLGDWAGTTLGMAKQEFSDLADGMVEEGLLRWDGTTLSLHSEGRALGAKVKAQGATEPGSTSKSDPAAGTPKKGKKKKADPEAKAGRAAVDPVAEAVVAEAVGVEPAAAALKAAPVVAAPKAAPVVDSPVVAPEDGHGHGHSHDHGHDHAHAAPAEQAPPPPRAKSSEPKAAPPRGLLGRLRCRIKKLLGR